MEDKIIEIARFNHESEAYTLITLLESEGIDCCLTSDIISRSITAYESSGGVKVEIPEHEAQHALRVMKEGGYILPQENSSDPIDDVSGWTSHIPFLKNMPIEKRILVFLGIIAILIALLIMLVSTI